MRGFLLWAPDCGPRHRAGKRLKPGLSQNLMTFRTWFLAMDLRVETKQVLNTAELNFVVEIVLAYQ